LAELEGVSQVFPCVEKCSHRNVYLYE
jgi:hypothetical protein